MVAYLDNCGTCVCRTTPGYNCVIKKEGNPNGCPCSICIKNDTCQEGECLKFLNFFMENVKYIAKKKKGLIYD